MTMPARPTTPTAAPCVACSTERGLIPQGCRKPWRAQGLCRKCYDSAYHKGLLTIDHAYVRRVRDQLPDIPALTPRTAADLGWPALPVTDAALVNYRVWQIGNTNKNRGFDWLRARGFTREDALAMAVWEPARLAAPETGEHRRDGVQKRAAA